MKKIGVIGIGLMGGSIALALKKSNPCFELYGLDKQQEHLEYALNNSIIDAKLNTSNCNLMDIIIIATPVKQVITVIKNHYSLFAENKTLITDMGSTKTYICNQVKENFPELNFIGGHPMTGGEVSGPQVAKADLFQSKIYVLIEDSNEDSNKYPGIRELSKIFKGIGARVITLTAEEHDKLVSFTSHLPQLLASSVINELISIENKNKNVNKLIGQGFRDFTRIAASNSEVWTDIFITNKDNISK